MTSRNISISLISILFVTMVIMMPVSSSPRECPILSELVPNLTKPGADLTIAYAAELHLATGVDPTGSGESVCDAEIPDGFMRRTAVITATDNWPDSIQLPGLSVGLAIYDVCNTYDLALFSAMRVANTRYNQLYASADVGNQTECLNQTLELGVLGYGRSAWSQPSSNLLEPFGIPVISATSTSDALSDNDKYPNFFRVIPPDSTAIKALVGILKTYGWTYSAMIYNEGNAYGLNGIKVLKEAYKEIGFCLSEPIAVPEGASDAFYDDIVSQLIQRNVKVVILWIGPANIDPIFGAVDRIRGAAYGIQWLSGDTALYFDYTQLPGHAKAARSFIVASPYVTTDAMYKTWLAQWYPDMVFDSADIGLLIDAVHVYMAAFSLAHQDKCGGQPGMCDALASIQGSEFIEYVRKVNFTGIGGNVVAFDENGDPVHRFYEILQYKSTGQPDTYSLQKVGEWTLDEGLKLNTDLVEFYGNNNSLTDPPNSTCEEGLCSDPACRYSTFVIEALFDLHGSKCNALQENRFTLVEAALFAVRQINQDPSFLPYVHLSMTVNDICGDTESAGRVAFRSLQRWDFNGGFPSQDDASYLMGMLHSGSSGKAIEESKLLQIADLPLIANSATSPLLSDKVMFGNFLRTVPPDTTQAAAMADLLVRLGLTYIQTINTRGVYGNGGIQVLQEEAKRTGICIANSFIIDSTTDYAQLISKLIANLEAKTLVLFLTDEHAQALFDEMVKRNIETGRFQILASDTWGTRTDFIPGLEAQALGALTVSFKTSVIPEFEDYLLNLTPETEDGSNPFFNEYWMQKFKCNLPGGEPVHAKNCTGSEMLSSSDFNSLGMENIINVIHVYAVSLSNLISDTCQDGGVCDALLDVTSQEWFEHLKEVDFVSPVGSEKMVSFDENGDGPPFLSVYRFSETNGSYSYEEIATWDNVNGLSNLTGDIINPMFTSVCTGLCLECNPSPDTNQTSDMDYFRIPGDLDLPVVLQLSDSGDGFMCGASRLQESLVLESLLYALDEVNDDFSILPGVKLGVTVVDSCGNPAIATRKLVGLLGDFVSLDSTGPPFAVLGPANPEVAEEIARSVTDPIELPMVTHSAASPDLDNYPLVLRTSAPYNQQVAAVVEITKEFNWTYVGVVFSETPYGRSNIQEFKNAAQKAGICIGAQRYITDTTDFDEVIRDFSSVDSLNVIVAFVHERDARNLLIADELNRDKKFTWVGTESWDSLALVSRLENTAKGMIVVANEEPDLPEIHNYFSDLNLLQAANVRNPYLRNYLQSSCSPSMSECQLEVQLQESVQELSGEISTLVNALYAVAYGANWLQDSKCGFSNQGLCADFLSSSPYDVVDAIQRVTLESGAGEEPFSFKGRSVPANYIIKNYQFDGQSGQLVIVGKWQDEQLSLQISGIELYNPDAEYPQRNPSGCSCDPNPLEDGDGSVQVHSWKWVDHGIWATVVLAMSAICGVLAILIAILFLTMRHSYVVQGASFSLSMWLLLGIILMYLLNLAFMFEVNTAICGIRRVGVSFVHCVVYAAMIVKSIRANRFARKKDGVDLNFAGSWSQSLLFVVFLLPEVFLVGEWLFLIPPKVSANPSVNDTCGNGPPDLMCATSNIDLTIFMMYAYFLVLVTFLSSFGALCASHSHHEGKPIFITSLFSILILIAWACVYNLDVIDPVYNIPAISIGLTAVATVILVFMFIGKVASLTKKEKLEDTGADKKDKHVDFETEPDKMIHVYDNTAIATADDEVAAGDEVTQF